MKTKVFEAQVEQDRFNIKELRNPSHCIHINIIMIKQGFCFVYEELDSTVETIQNVLEARPRSSAKHSEQENIVLYI